MIITRSRIQRELLEIHWAELHRLIQDRRARGIEVVAWLRERGYTMSRTAIFNYRQKLLCGGYPGAALTATELAAARQRAADYAAQFNAEKLCLFVSYGDFLAGQCAGSSHPASGAAIAPAAILASEASGGLPEAQLEAGTASETVPEAASLWPV